MSKIFSRPKMPSQPALPQYIPPAPTHTSSDTSDKSDAENTSASDQEKISNILSRHRGRSGTIGTSLRGVLNDVLDGNGQPTRKTLLGD